MEDPTHRSSRLNVPIVVVPCFNEERRIDEAAFLDLARAGEMRLLFVNDGSTDGTSRLLHCMAGSSENIEMLEIANNVGKAEAVRLGLLRAIEEGAAIVGYFDADLATPGSGLQQILRLLEDRDDLSAVFGSRMARLGSHIERSPLRHYIGRVYATVASWALDVAVYDTQCGAKVFKVSPNLVASLDRPFRSAWSFDVLLCQRLFDGTSELPGLPATSFLELPLDAWRDVAGSKVRFSASIAALWDVFHMGVMRRLDRRNRGWSGSDATEPNIID